MSTTDKTIYPVRNGEVTALAKGEIVRVGTVAQTLRRASGAGEDQTVGLLGVTLVGGRPDALVPTVLVGPTEVLMEEGLTLAPQDAIYVSGSVPGRGTNVAPADPVRIGWVLSTALYASRGLVLGAVTAAGPGAATPGGGIEVIDGSISLSNFGGGFVFGFPMPASVVARMRYWLTWSGNDDGVDQQFVLGNINSDGTDAAGTQLLVPVAGSSAASGNAAATVDLSAWNGNTFAVDKILRIQLSLSDLFTIGSVTIAVAVDYTRV